MIHTDPEETTAPANPCSATQGTVLTEAQERLARDVLGRLSGKWALWVLHVLGEANGPMRFTRVSEAVEGISQKVLTRTLRQLECDGFVTRTLYPQVPPRVDYALTDLGRELLVRTAPLLAWVVAEVGSFEAARMRLAGRAS